MFPRFPLFIDLNTQPCLVVGGGAVGTRRVETLRRCGAKVRVVSQAFSEALVAWAAAEGEEGRGLELVERPFRDRDVEGMRLVVSATDSREVNAQVARASKLAKIPVNVCDDPEASNFHFPGLVTRGQLAVGINTNGASPTVSKQVREIIEMVLPDDFGNRISRFGRKDPLAPQEGDPE
ncbi:MAG TPA: bifunctional precorrin-2 dehydrogenase/sirohydrochlorin ferrochelatase [Fibrobacteraceae bacterium]|nr:bifunctional precorrin-2 dehydrogenase/sirohydrochlorin ferrochelatase [Fibrobacteraceae bacterium]